MKLNVRGNHMPSMRTKALAAYITEAGGFSGDAAQEILDCIALMERETDDLRARVECLERAANEAQIAADRIAQ